MIFEDRVQTSKGRQLYKASIAKVHEKLLNSAQYHTEWNGRDSDDLCDHSWVATHEWYEGYAICVNYDAVYRITEKDAKAIDASFKRGFHNEYGNYVSVPDTWDTSKVDTVACSGEEEELYVDDEGNLFIAVASIDKVYTADRGRYGLWTKDVIHGIKYFGLKDYKHLDKVQKYV